MLEIVLILVVVVLLPVLWVRSLSKRISALEGKVATLQRRLDQTGPLATEAPQAKPAESEDKPMPWTQVTAAAAESPVPAPTAKPAAARQAAQPKRSASDLEQMVGSRWSVILGGIAIAMGALFLVRYSIEAGLLGPGARTFAGALLAIALLTGGEWLRRRDRKLSIPAIENADIPGILTGAGVIAAFGTLYAAHALYGFIGPALAFIGLTLIGLASLALSAVHGPKLAAIGMLGAYGAPLLVSSDTPNPLALALHVLAVTASVMGVARVRGWLWLAFGGVAGGIAWATLGALTDTVDSALWSALTLVGLALIFVATFGWQASERPDPLEDRSWDRPALLAFALLPWVYLVHAGALPFYPVSAVALGLGVIMVSAASLWPALAPISLVSVAIMLFHGVVLDLAPLHEPGLHGQTAWRENLVPVDIGGYSRMVAGIAAVVALLAIGGAWRAAATAPRMAGSLATTASAIAVLTLVLAYLRIAPFETHVPTGIAALLLGAGFTLLTELFSRKRVDDWRAPAPAALAVGAVSLLAFGIGVLLSRSWFPLGFALATLGIAWIWTTRPLRALPILSAATAILCGASIWASAPFPLIEIGATPFLNALVLLAGLPAAAVLAAGEILRRNGSVRPAAIVTTLGLTMLALFVALELRHWITGGQLVSGRVTLADSAVQTIAALGFAIGLQRLARYTQASIFDQAAKVAGAISALAIVLALFLVHNPLFNAQSVGLGKVFNLLLPAYLITGLMAAVVTLMARPVRPRWYVGTYALLSGGLLFLYATLMTRQWFQTDGWLDLGRRTSDLELWTYSAVWLAMGGLVLALGLRFRSLAVRAASAAIILLTVLKVFLFDMSALTGVLRALSFIGLGLSLLAIGRFYQRILARTGNDPSGQD